MLGFAIPGLTALAGGKRDRTDQESYIEMNQPVSPEESKYRTDAWALYNQMLGGMQSGDEIAGYERQGRGAQQDLADLLGRLSSQTLSETGMPSAADFSSGASFAESVFKPREVAMRQEFIDQTTEANRTAAMLGRSIDDPILQAKLRTGFMRQADQLAAERGAMASQYAYAQPERRLGFMQQGLAMAGDRASILSGLATQAFQNRAAIMSMGNQLEAQEWNRRLQLAKRVGATESGGGFKGGVEGGLAGLAFTVDLAKSLMGAGGGGGGSGNLQAPKLSGTGGGGQGAFRNIGGEGAAAGAGYGRSGFASAAKSVPMIF